MMDFVTVEKGNAMANEKRLIDADALIKEAYAEGAYGYVDAKQIADAPTVDAVEIVRCRDCKHHRDKNEYEKRYLVEDALICTSPDATDDCWNTVWPDHFCSCGKRREDDD